MGSWLRSRVGWVLGIVAASIATIGAAADGPNDPNPLRRELPTLHDDFETPGAVWQRERTDTTINLLAHERSDRAAYDGKQSERFQFEADQGSQFLVSYPLPKVRVSEKLEVALYARSNRAGVQLFVRVILPSDVDPETRAPSFVLVPGTIFDRVDRWQRLEVLRMLPSIEKQARVLRVSSRRPVSLEGAYIDRVVVNLMVGAGPSEVFLDDLSVGPVEPQVLADWSPPGAEGEPAREAAIEADDAGAKPAPYDRIRLESNKLRKRDEGDGQLHEWFPTAIEADGADVAMLRRHGFDILVDKLDADPDRIQTALKGGFTLMPKLTQTKTDEDVAAQIKEIESYPYKEAVSFWMAGEGFGRSRELKAREAELARTQKLIREIRGMPPTFSRLTTGIVEGELPLYARTPANLDAIGIKANHWGTAQDQAEFYKYLVQRRLLTTRSNVGQFFWAWIPAAASDSLRRNIWGEEPPPSWGVPRVLPEQLRLMTYLALSAGYRGVGFLGDADLTRPAGRALLIEMAILNLEIDLVQSMLAKSGTSIPIYPVFDPDPPDLPPPGASANYRVRLQPEFKPKPDHKAAAVSVDRSGALLLLADYTTLAQFQPHQMAARSLVVRAVLPETAQAFKISPGGVEYLKRDHHSVGTRITLPEFDVTAMILCTTDMTLKDRLERAIQGARPMAVQLAIEQAEWMLKATAEANGRLAADGHTMVTDEDEKRNRSLGLTRPINEAEQLLATAAESIKSARDLSEREEFDKAWDEARRALRPLRILAFAHWVKGYSTFAKASSRVRFDGAPPDDPSWGDKPPDYDPRPIQPPVLIKPVCCPPLVSFSTLPEAYIWLDWIKGKPGYRFGDNRVPSGSFDDPRAMTDAGWMDLSYQMEGITSKMAPVLRGGSKTDRMIRLSVEPKNPEDLEKTLPAFLDFPAAAVRSPSVPVKAGNMIRISVQVKRRLEGTPGAGGIIVRDSIGGEQLQFRTTDPIPQFSRVVLYRKAPADGEVSVTFGLAGYGDAWFDDFRIELIEEDRPSSRAGGNLANEARPSPDRRQPPTPDPGLPASAETPEQKRPRRR
jgi:hypothetical protein